MRKIKIFLASSSELRPDRIAFEVEIYRKTKGWIDQGTFLHLDIWEDLHAHLTTAGLQDEYNKAIREADIFVLLAYSKLGIYTAEEFEAAFGQFKSTQKPFIFTYFKDSSDIQADPSIDAFKAKLKELKHYYSRYKDFNDLWNQFNKELDRLYLADFAEFQREDLAGGTNIQGDGNVSIQGNSGNVNIHQGNVQNAEKIYNIEHIDKADFS